MEWKKGCKRESVPVPVCWECCPEELKMALCFEGRVAQGMVGMTACVDDRVGQGQVTKVLIAKRLYF